MEGKALDEAVRRAQAGPAPGRHDRASVTAGRLTRSLGLADSVALVAGTIIGAGIFTTPNLVARQLPSPLWMLAAWAFAGVLSFFGALAYAELGAAMPASGGQYVFLREAYGSLVAFLCGWAFFLIILSGAVAWLAVMFSLYVSFFVALAPLVAKVLALALIAALTAVNCRGVRPGAAVQKTFAVLKLGGLSALILAALLAPPGRAASVPATAFSWTQFGAALVACLLTYDGWTSLSLVAGEVREPQRTLPRSLFIGLALCVSLYMLANLAYIRVLSIDEIAAADRVASAMAMRVMGPRGAAVVSLVILLSIVGSANGWILAAPRLLYAQASDGLFFRRFAAVHPRFHTPAFAIALFGAWSGLLALTGSYETLASYAMFATWLFYGLTVAGVVVLRRRRPELPRPYRMWGYPATPLLFAAIALWFVVNTFITAPGPSLIGTLLIASGIPAYWLWRGRVL